ncbi:hypothetical protein L208DRAFT_662977 [Tricholoma matsutake]|nr:hypothetical protein L208DRAFT_662977 [Tricholoma matsutake 945]
MAATRFRPRGHNSLHLRATAIRDAASVAEPSPTPTAIFRPPLSVAAVAAVTSLVGSLIILSLGIALWRCRIKRRRSEQAPALVKLAIVEKEHVVESHIDLDDVAIYMEKPERTLAYDPSDLHAGWVPQIRSQHSTGVVDVYAPIPTSTAKNKMKPRPLHITVTPPSEDSYDLRKSLSPRDSSIPTKLSFIHIPPPISSTISTPTPPTPPVARKPQTNFTSLREEVLQAPTPSPRSESFIAQEVVLSGQGPSEDSGNDQDSKFSRLMTVVTSFTPSLADELSVEIGESVRMLNEYGDGWCLVQRVGNNNAPKGVVPRSCLNDESPL